MNPLLCMSAHLKHFVDQAETEIQQSADSPSNGLTMSEHHPQRKDIVSI